MVLAKPLNPVAEILLCNVHLQRFDESQMEWFLVIKNFSPIAFLISVQSLLSYRDNEGEGGHI